MPPQTGKSSLFKKLGKRFTSAVKAHAHDELRAGRIDLPPGIKNGKARLTKLYFDQYKTGDNKGETYLRGEGVVVFPKNVMTENGDVKVEGLTTSVMFACCETKTQAGKVHDLDENMAAVTNALQLLGADPDEIEATAEEDGGIEAIAAALVPGKDEDPRYFKFSTSAKKDQKTGMVIGAWENWHGIEGLEDYDPETGDDVVDETGGDAEPEPDVEEEEEAKAPSKNGKPKVKSKAPAEDEPANDDSEEPDLDALAEAADNEGDKAAQKELKRLALAAGISAKKIEQVDNWTALADQIKAKTAPEEDDEDDDVDDDTEEATAEEDEEPYSPDKGDLVMYKGKKDKKPAEYEVTAVFKAKKLVNLLSNEDKKTEAKLVKWDDISVS